MSRRFFISVLPALVILTACADATPTSAPGASAPTENASQPSADLTGLKGHVEKQSDALHTSVGRLQDASNQYYDLAKGANFDYRALWASQPDEVLKTLGDARAAFVAANPQYEQMEGVVAGVPSLSQYDVLLDAGAAGDGEDAAPIDLALPDGRTLHRPGNLFEVTEATLWGTDPTYIVAGINPDFNGNGQVDTGDTLPDANVLKGAADAFEKVTSGLKAAAGGWEPTEAEAFGALIANVPTFTDFMESWKNSRLIKGEQSDERGFVATSRLSDLSDNILSWQTIYAGLSPAARQVAPDEDARITRDLKDLHDYVSSLYAQEKAGKHFTPEEVDTLNAEGQTRATAIAGQITQMAARMGVQLEAQ